MSFLIFFPGFLIVNAVSFFIFLSRTFAFIQFLAFTQFLISIILFSFILKSYAFESFKNAYLSLSSVFDYALITASV